MSVLRFRGFRDDPFPTASTLRLRHRNASFEAVFWLEDAVCPEHYKP